MSIRLEHVPDVVVGKLLAGGVAVECSIGNDVDNALSAFVSSIGVLGSLDQGFSGFVLNVTLGCAEFFNSYPALSWLVIRAEGAPNTDSGPYDRSPTRIARFSAKAVRAQGVQASKVNITLSESSVAASFPEAGASWSDLFEGQDAVSQDDPLPRPVGYRRIPFLNRLPWIQVGQLRAQGVNVDEAHLSYDRDGKLTLHFEFPLGPVDDVDENRRRSDILKIVECSAFSFRRYPELQRLAIWTRPEWSDQIAILPFWLRCEDVLKYGRGEIAADELRARMRDYNP